MSFDKKFDHSQELFEAALQEFIEKGYDQASINIILQKADMSKGQFYYHFKNKEGLYFALIDILIARKGTFLASVMQPEDFQADIFTIFQTQIRYGLAFARKYPAINQFAESFVREKGNDIYEKALRLYSFEDNQMINQLIESAYAKGEFREDIPLSFIKKAIGYLFTHVAELADLHEADTFEDNLNYLVQFMRSGLARQ